MWQLIGAFLPGTHTKCMLQISGLGMLSTSDTQVTSIQHSSMAGMRRTCKGHDDKGASHVLYVQCSCVHFDAAPDIPVI
jgi:hypothetical protein